MLAALFTLPLAAATPCERLSIAGLAAAAPAPAIVVLGERHGVREDLSMAWEAARALQATGPVTLALEAVNEEYQSVLDGWQAEGLSPRALRRALDWEESWGFAWRPYAPLVTAGTYGIPVVAAGTPLGPKPADRAVPVPEGYWELLAPLLGGHPMAADKQARFVTSMAWRDFRIGELAISGWNGQGHLVIVTGRGHVEGGKGTNWQLQQRVGVPVVSALLSEEGARCLPGDQILSRASSDVSRE